MDALKLGEAAYYGLAGEFTHLYQLHTEADPAGLLPCFLAAFGNNAGRNYYAIADGSRHYGNLFVTIVGRSAKARKGTAMRRVRNFFSEVDPSWTMINLSGGLTTGEGLIWDVRDPSYKEEKGETVCVDKGVADKRRLYFEPEFSSVIERAQGKGNTLGEILRDSWDRGDLKSTSKINPGSATGAYISVVGNITDEELLLKLNSNNQVNGFANRHLWFLIARPHLLPFSSEPDHHEVEDLAFRVRRVLAEVRQPRLIGFSAAARELWEELYPKLNIEVPGIVGRITARGDAQTLRLALVYAMTDAADAIRLEHLNAAYTLWQYSEESVKAIFAGRTGNPDADSIIAALRSNPEGLTRSDISAHFGRNLSVARLDMALGMLLTANLATKQSERTSGRTAERWLAINPN
jgi:hypothetical protein